MNDTRMFAFESDFVATLRCIPMAVRFKLDRVAIKLSLRQWSRFTREDRRVLLLKPCRDEVQMADYRRMLVELVALRAGETAKPLADPPLALWEDPHHVPEVVIDHALSIGARPPSRSDWASLGELQRFVLIKLTRDNHDNVNFVPALKEFGLASNKAVAA